MPATPDHVLPGAATRAMLARIRRRRVARGLLDGLARGVLVASSWMLLVALADRWRPLGSMTRAALLFLLAATLVAGAARLFRRLGRECRDPVLVGRLVERSHPPLRDRLVTLLTPAPSSPALLRELADLVERECSALQASRLLPLGHLLRPLRLLAIPLVMIAGIVLWSPLETRRSLSRLLFPLRHGDPGDAWTIEVVPGDVELKPGQVVRIEARRSPRAGQSSAATTETPRLTWHGGGVRRVETMTPASGGFVASLRGIESDAWYEIEWSGRRSTRHFIRVLRPPGVRSMTSRAGDSPTAVSIDPSSARLAFPAGSRVEIAVEATQPLVSATMESGPARVAGTIAADESRATFVLPVDRDGTWRVKLVGKNGLESDPRLRLEVVAIADEPPVVRTANALLRVSPNGQVRLPYLVGDDHGLASLRVLGDGRLVVFERSPPTPDTRVMQGLAVFRVPGTSSRGLMQFRLEARDSRGAAVLGPTVAALTGVADVGVFDQLRPALLLAVRQSLADAIGSLRQLEASLGDPSTALERKEDAAERLRRGLERAVIAATDADEPLLGSVAGLADRLAAIRREVMDLPPEPPRATDVERLRQAVEQSQGDAAHLRRASLAWLIRATGPPPPGANTRPASRELASAIERAAAKRQAWARELGVQLDDGELPAKLDRLIADASGTSPPGIPGLLGEWRSGGSSESIADRLLIRGRVLALSRQPRPSDVADTITLARAVRAIGRREIETASRDRDRLLEDWQELQEARSAGAVFAAARLQRRLQALGERETAGHALLAIAGEASAAGESLLDLADRWRSLHSVADRLDPADLELLRNGLLEEARLVVERSPGTPSPTTDLLRGPRPDTADLLERLADEVSATRFGEVLWQGAETTESLRAALNPEPTRGLPRTLALLTERVGRWFDTGNSTPTAPSGGHGDAEALRAYFRLLSRDTGD